MGTGAHITPSRDDLDKTEPVYQPGNPSQGHKVQKVSVHGTGLVEIFLQGLA